MKQTSFILALLITGMLTILPRISSSHCQVPCGIYDDHARVDSMLEDAATVVKAASQMAELSGKADAQSVNQMVRWVMNKEEHADEISNIATHYFLTQRIKSVDKNDSEAYKEYLNKLTLIHEIVVFSMKAKQTTDLANIEKLRKLLLNGSEPFVFMNIRFYFDYPE